MSPRTRPLLPALLLLAGLAAGCGGGSQEAATAPTPAAPVRPDQQGASGKGAAPEAKSPGASVSGRKPGPQSAGPSSTAGGKKKLPRIVAAPGQTRADARRIVEQLLQGKRKVQSGSSQVKNAGQVLRELVKGKRRRQSAPPSAKTEAPTKVLEEVLNGAR